MSVPKYDPPPRKSGGGWLTVLVVVLLLIGLSCAGLCGGCVYFTRQAAQQAGQAIEEFAENLQLVPAMMAAQEAVTTDPQVIERLGAPVTVTTPATRHNKGQPKPAGETFQFDVRGPKGEGIASAVAASNGPGAEFRLETITVRFVDDDEIVNVPVPAAPADTTSPAPENEPDSGAIQLDPELNEPIQAK